ncbi:MAG: hypothetical protein AMXMBFR33_01830 [Candidatus Xenobia bacterium]
MTDQLLSITQVCAELGYGRSTVRTMIRRGELTAVRRGTRGRLRIRRSVVEQWKLDHELGQPPAPRPRRRCPSSPLIVPPTPQEVYQRTLELSRGRRKTG